jgi:hypothetical protein
MKLRAIFTAMAIALMASSASGQVDTPSPNPALPKFSTIMPDTTMVLIPGRKLTITLDKDLKPVMVAEAAAPDNPAPGAVPRVVEETWTKIIDPKQIKIESGVLGLALYSTPGKGTVLIAANGLDQGIIYSASLVLKRGERLVVYPTTICAAGPGSPGTERWPEDVAAIIILQVRHIQGSICYDPETGRFYEPGQQPPSSAPAAPSPPRGSEG